MRRSGRAGTDCKSVAYGLSRFESYHLDIWRGVVDSAHQILALKVRVRSPSPNLCL